METLPQNISELKSYILSFNEQESIHNNAESEAQSNSLDYMSVNKSKLYNHISNIQGKIQPLRIKYTKLLATLSNFEFDDNLSYEKKNIIFLHLRYDIVQVLKDITEPNQNMAPLQPLLPMIMDEESI